MKRIKKAPFGAFFVGTMLKFIVNRILKSEKTIN